MITSFRSRTNILGNSTPLPPDTNAAGQVFSLPDAKEDVIQETFLLSGGWSEGFRSPDYLSFPIDEPRLPFLPECILPLEGAFYADQTQTDPRSRLLCSLCPTRGPPHFGCSSTHAYSPWRSVNNPPQKAVACPSPPPKSTNR